MCLDLSVLATFNLSAAQLQPSNLLSQSFLLVLYSVYWYLKHHLRAGKAAVAAYSIETPIIQKILTYCSDFSFYKRTSSLCLQFKEGLLCIRRCCTLGCLCTEICNFAWIVYCFKLVQIVGEKLWKPNLCKQSHFLLRAVGLGGWACSALEPGFVGVILHIPHFQAPGLGKARALNVLISFACTGKGAEATLGGLRRNCVVPGAVVKFKGSRLSAHNISPSLCSSRFVLNIKTFSCYNFGGRFTAIWQILLVNIYTCWVTW